MDMGIKGKSALVTGGSRGIGREAARQFLEEGVRVTICGRTAESLERTRAELARATGGEIHAVVADMTKEADIARLVDSAKQRFGTVDILVNNAGIVRDRSLLKMEESDFDAVIGVHLKGTFNCTRHAAPVMKEKGYGRIVNITSSAGLRGNFGQTNYGAAKAGLMGMTFVWALELGKYGVTVNAIAPSGATRMTASLFEKAGSEPPAEENPALNAPLVAYVASEDAAHVNGQILGRTEYAYTLFQQPKQIAWMWRDGGWTASEVAQDFDKTLGQHLQQVGMVMPKSMTK
jgi:3-oxoacyl-[acyl-carrier protein] reductase